MKRLAFAILGLSLSACATKKLAETPGASKTSSSEPAAASTEPRFYYADVQIVAETSPETSCADDKKNTQRVELEKFLSLTDDKQIKFPEDKRIKLFGVNLNLQMMGFDLAHYSFSSMDGELPKEFPFPMSLRRIPGGLLELHYLDQTVAMRLSQTPIYTFTAKEVRDGCTLIHNVNVFGENANFYPLAD